MELLRPYPDVIDNKCCDVLFGEYLRRLNSKMLYAIVNLKLYNYRIDNNSDSITGEIKQLGNVVRKPMDVTPDNMEECAKDLDKYLDEHIDIYIHDTYLRTIVGMDFDTILKYEFMNEYNVLGLVKKEHMQKIYDFHSRLRQVANLVFDVKL
jgi:mRNA-degrading endonuclease HigB of HigAB toxin-antitoxin module